MKVLQDKLSTIPNSSPSFLLSLLQVACWLYLSGSKTLFVYLTYMPPFSLSQVILDGIKTSSYIAPSVRLSCRHSYSWCKAGRSGLCLHSEKYSKSCEIRQKGQSKAERREKTLLYLSGEKKWMYHLFNSFSKQQKLLSEIEVFGEKKRALLGIRLSLKSLVNALGRNCMNIQFIFSMLNLTILYYLCRIKLQPFMIQQVVHEDTSFFQITWDHNFFLRNSLNIVTDHYHLASFGFFIQLNL